MVRRYDDKIWDAGVRYGQTSGVCLRPKIGTREVPTLSYHLASEYQRLLKCGDYRCPPGMVPVLTRPLDSEWWSRDIPWYNSGPFGVPLDVSCSLQMLGVDTDTEIALYHSQFTAEFIDWETTIMTYQRLVQQHLERTEQPPATGPTHTGSG